MNEKVNARELIAKKYAAIHEKTLAAEAEAEAARQAALEAEAARKRAEAIKIANMKNAAATKIQATFRGYQGTAAVTAILSSLKGAIPHLLGL